MTGSNRNAHGTPDGPDAPRPRRRRWLRRALIGGGAVGALAILVWIAVATGFLMDRAVTLALSRVTPEGWEVHVGEVEGSWLSPVRLADVRLTGPEGFLTIDSILVRYGVSGLLDREVLVRELRVHGPRGELNGVPETASDTSRTQPLAWSILIDDARLSDGHASLSTASGTYVVDSVRLSARAWIEGGSPSVELRSLDAVLRPPEGAPPGRLSASGTLAEGVVSVERLALVSPRSRLEGSGSLPLELGWPPSGRADFTLRARPLDLRDLPLGWGEGPSRVELEARVRSDAASATLDLGVRGPGPAVATVSAVARDSASAFGPAGVVVTVAVEEVAIPPGAEAPTTVSGDLRFAAQRVDLDTPYELDATLRVAGLPFPEGDPTGGPVAAEDHGDDGGQAARSAGVLDGPLRLSVEASGRDLRPDSAAFVAVVRVTSAPRPRALPFARLEVGRERAVGTLGPLAWAISMDVDGASVRGHGGATVGEGRPWTVDVERLGVDDLDLSALLSALPATRVSGSLEGRMRGTPGDGARPEGDFDVRLGPSRIASTSIDSASLRGEVVDGVLTGEVRVAAMGGTARAGVVAAPFDSIVTADVLEGRFEGIEAAERTVLTGSLEGSIRLPGAGPEARLQVRLDSTSVVRDVPLSRGTLDVVASGSGAEVEGHLELGDSGFVDLSAVATGLGEVPTYRIRRARFERVPAAIASQGRIVRGSLTGGAELEVTGATPEAMRGGGRVWLERSTIGRGTIDSAWVDVEVDSGRVELAGGAAPAAGGRLVLAGEGRLGTDSARVRGELAGSLPALGGFLGLPSEAAAVDSLLFLFQASRSGARWDAFGGELLVRSALWQGVRVDSARVDLRYDDAGFALDTLAVRSTAFSVAGSGRIGPAGGPPGRLTVSGDVEDLSPLSELTGVELPSLQGGELTLVAEGTVDSLALDAEMDARSLSRAGYRLAVLRLDGTGTVVRPASGRAMAVRGSADLSLSRLSTPDTDVSGIEVHVEGGPDSVRVVATADVDRRRTARLLLTIDPRPDYRQVRVDTVAFQLDEDVWGLDAPATVSYLDGVSVDGFALAAGGQRIEVSGAVDDEGRLDIDARIDSTGIATVADLVGLPGLTGWVAGNLRLTGTTDAPVGHATLEGHVGPADGRRGTITATLSSDGVTLEVDARVVDPQGAPLSLSGTAPPPSFALADTVAAAADGSGAPLDLEVRADSFHVGWLGPFVDPRVATGIGGTLSADLRLTGTGTEPRLDGTLAWTGGRVTIPKLGMTWTDGSVHARGDGAYLVVEDASVSSGLGTASATGRVGWAALEDAPLDLHVELSDFEAANTVAYRARISGAVDVGGNVLAPALAGRIDVESLDFYLGETTTADGFADVTLTEADLRMLEERFGWVPEPERGRAPLTDRMTADLQVRLGPDSWVRNRSRPELAAAFTGTVDVTMRPGEEIDAVGTITATPGRGFVEQFGRRFQLEEGTVELDGAPQEARLDLTATYDILSHQNPDEAEVTIRLEIEGTREDLELTLSSSPVMENADMVSYIATGRPASGPATFGGADSEEGLVAAGAGLALSQMVEIVEGAAARGIGLDVVEIRHEGLREATLAAGKYVTPRTYVGFAQPVSLREGDGLSLGGGARSEIEIEYEALRWLVLNLETSGADWRFFLRGRHAY